MRKVALTPESEKEEKLKITIDKAQNVLKILVLIYFDYGWKDEVAALNLANEAMQWIKDNRGERRHRDNE